MEIDLGNRFKIVTDANEYKLVKANRDEGYNTHGHFSKISQALVKYVELKVRTKEGIDTVKKLVKYQNELLEEIKDIVEPLDIEIEVKRKNEN